MAVAMAVVVATHADSLAGAFTIVIMAGLIQILLGALKVGRFVAYTPYSVISGFMSGIGIIIILLQTLPFLGASIAEGGPLGAVRAWPDVITDVNFSALAIAAVTLGVGVFWPNQLKKFLPPTLAALVAGTLLGLLWLTNTPTIGEVPTGLPSWKLPDLAVGVLAGAVQPALIIALLGSIDSLLTSLVADSMTRTRHNPDRELAGQGIGNVIAGFIGGLPGAGATMGTVVNIRAGGRTQVSGVLRAAILLGLVLGLGRLRRVDSPCGSRRHLDEGRMGHHRLALHHPDPSSSAGTPFRHVHHSRAHGVPRLGDCRRYRPDRRRNGQR